MNLKAGKWIILAALVGVLTGIGYISMMASDPQVLSVCPSGCNYKVIQNAIEAASAGDTIKVKAGTYQENLVIKKPLTLQGVNAKRTIIEGAKEGYPTIRIKKTSVGQVPSVKTEKTPSHEVEEAPAPSIKVKDVTIIGAFGEECANLDKGVCSDGLLIEDLAWATIINSIISNNQRHGIVIGDLAWTTVTDSTISGNKDGIFFKELGTAAILRNKIINNQHYGVSLFQKPCYDTDTTFKGHISGKANEIPGPREENGNGKGAICPKGLNFLMTKRGGKYP